jgi:hypothetical protein
MLTRADPALDHPMILFQDVIEVLHRSMLAVLLQSRAWRTIAGYEAIHMIRKGQSCWSAAGVKVCLLHRFIVGMFGIEA